MGRYGFNADQLKHNWSQGAQTQCGLKDGRWVLARPYTLCRLYLKYRLRACWDVLRGEADALYWTGQGKK